MLIIPVYLKNTDKLNNMKESQSLFPVEVNVQDIPREHIVVRCIFRTIILCLYLRGQFDKLSRPVKK